MNSPTNNLFYVAYFKFVTELPATETNQNTEMEMEESQMKENKTDL